MNIYGNSIGWLAGEKKLPTDALGNKAIGDIVKISVNNALRDFIVVQHGRPGEIYDNGWNDTTILLMKDIYEKRAWNNTNVSDYANSQIHTYLNNAFLDLLDPKVKNYLATVKIPYRAGSSGTTASSGANGLPVKAFLLAASEIGFNSSFHVVDGELMTYFQSATAVTRIAYLNGTSTRWSLRTALGDNARVVVCVYETGSSSNQNCVDVNGIRPALAFPQSTRVASDGSIQ